MLMVGHLESMFISSQDVAELTASARSAVQVRWLRANGIPFILGGDGSPKVARQMLLSKLGLPPSDLVMPVLPVVGATEEPIPSLAEAADNWDIVTESLMAELLGLTRRALEGRRFKGAIPADVWRKLDGRVMYSIKRYEAFLDGHWPAFVEPTNISSNKPARRKKGFQGKRTSIYQLV